MRHLSPSTNIVGYVTAISVIGGLMAFVVTGVSAIDATRQQNSAKVSLLDRR